MTATIHHDRDIQSVDGRGGHQATDETHVPFVAAIDHPGTDAQSPCVDGGHHCTCGTQIPPVAATDHTARDAQWRIVGGGHQRAVDAQTTSVAATDQTLLDAQRADVGGGHHSIRDDQACVVAATDHRPSDDHSSSVGGGPPSPEGQDAHDAQIGSARGVEDALLLVHADLLGDIEQVRIAHENRIRSLTTTWEVDGVTHGKGLPEGLPEVGAMRDMLGQIQAMEHGATLMLKRAMRRHYLAQWVKDNVGVGEKQAARLIAAIGDPATRLNPAKLWAYCGLHVIPHVRIDAQGNHGDDGRHPDHQETDDHIACVGVAPTRARGQRANWSTEAKSRVYVVAESCIKQIGPPSTKRRSPYRDVYDDGRAKYADAVHPVECKRCGPKGDPAAVGSPLSDGHKHARAMRLVSKRILLDLWREARRTLPASEVAAPIQGAPGDAPTGHVALGTQRASAGGGEELPTSDAATPTAHSSGGGTPSHRPSESHPRRAGGAA